MKFHKSNQLYTISGILATAFAASMGPGCSGTSNPPPVGSGGAIEAGGSTSGPTGGAPVGPAGGAPVTTTGGKAPVGTGGKAPVATGGAPVTTTGGASSGPTPASCTPPTTGHYQMEDLDRGVVAVKVTGGVYVGWRMMGYEYDPTTPANVSYNLYKDGAKLTNVTSANGTNYLDAAGTATSSYSVSAVIGGVECAKSAAVTPWAQNYLQIPISQPPPGSLGGTYSASDASPGDLDGDGKLDIVLKWDPSNSKDSASSGQSDDVIIDGYTLDGKKLWRIDVGFNIRAGAHDTQMSVYDFDGDGKAELAIKTAPGTKDGLGNYLKTGPAAGADNTKDYRSARGMALSGPEWLTVFDGATGAERATIEYPVLYSSCTTAVWGDSNGNRSQRFNGGFAFVKDNGVATGKPSIIQGRGYYTRLTVSALTYRNGTLAQNWVYDSVTPIANGGGDHSEMAADTDGDLGQEIITGATTINSDGKFKCSSQMGHGDAMDIAQLAPGKGIAVFSIHESLGGMDMHDGATCTSYFKTTEPGTDSNRGRAEYVGTGNESSASCYCGSCNVHQALCIDGSAAGQSPGTNFVMYWDDDLWRETENGTSISKVGGGTLLSATNVASCNSSKSTPNLSADLLGDWREELVLHDSSAAQAFLRVYTTTTVTTNRIYTLMHDPTYRAQVNFEQSAYNQPPHTGFQISPNAPAPPKPDINIVPNLTR